MADATYLDIILEQLEACGDAINALLVDADLAPLVQWYRGRPVPYRQNQAPYAWYQWGPRGKAQNAELDTISSFAAPIMVFLGLTGSSPTDLVNKAAAYVPRIQAAIESTLSHYYLVSTGFDLVTDDEEDGHFELYCIKFQVAGDRAVGGLS